MDFETDDTSKDPFEDILDQYPGATLMNVTGNPYAAINARGLQMDANALAAAGLNSFTSSATPATTGGGNITLQDILNLPLTEEAERRIAVEKVLANLKWVLDDFNEGIEQEKSNRAKLDSINEEWANLDRSGMTDDEFKAAEKNYQAKLAQQTIWNEQNIQGLTYGNTRNDDFEEGVEKNYSTALAAAQQAVADLGVTRAEVENWNAVNRAPWEAPISPTLGTGATIFDRVGDMASSGLGALAEAADWTGEALGDVIGMGDPDQYGPTFPAVGGVGWQWGETGHTMPVRIGTAKDGTPIVINIPGGGAVQGAATAAAEAPRTLGGLWDIIRGTYQGLGGIGGIATAAAAHKMGLEEDDEDTDSTLGAIYVPTDDTVGGEGIGEDPLTANTVATTGAVVETPQQIAVRKTMKVFDDAGGGEKGKAAVLKALEDNGLTIADLSEQTGVSIAELETFLTPAGTGADIVTTGTGADIVTTGTGTDIVVETPQQIAYKKAMKVFDDAGGGEAGKAAVLQALEDNNLSLQDLATQTGVSLDEIKTFLGLGGLTIDGGTTTSTVGPVLPDSATGILGLDTTGPTLTKRVDIGAKPDALTKRVDYGPLDLKKSIDALDQKLELKKGIGALEQQRDLKRGVVLTGEPSIGGGISELRSGPSFGGAVTLETGPNASGTLEHVPGASTTYRSSLGEDFPGAAATLRASLNEPGDLKGTLRAGGLEETLTAGEVFKGELKGSTSPAEKTSTLRGSSSSSSSGGMSAPMGGGSPGEGAGEPGDLTEIEYLFQRFGDTIFAPELTKAEENELLYPYR